MALQLVIVFIYCMSQKQLIAYIYFLPRSSINNLLLSIYQSKLISKRLTRFQHMLHAFVGAFILEALQNRFALEFENVRLRDILRFAKVSAGHDLRNFTGQN